MGDENTPGRPSDHNVLVVAPRSDLVFAQEREKKSKAVHLYPCVIHFNVWTTPVDASSFFLLMLYSVKRRYKMLKEAN